MMKKDLKYGVPILAGLLVLPVPLLGNFHIESAILVSIIGSFWAALRACNFWGSTNEGEIWQPFFILGYGYLFGLPLFLYAILTGCFSINGLGFWVLYPLPSILLSYSIGRLLRKWKIPLRRVIAVFILLFISIGVWAVEFFHFPQVYFFNHIWGGWPGPIYDETIKITWPLVFFRGITAAWIGLLWWLPAAAQWVKAKIIILLCAAVLIVAYSYLPELGIVSPGSYLQEQLGGKKETPHFILYYDKAHYSKDEIGFIAQKQEFYYRQIADTLHLGKVKSTRKIESYFYAHAWQKKALVGAKFTSYVPIWLTRGQLHIAKQQVGHTLKHELVHVMAKRFGNRLFNGSWSVGLIEGLAVALAPDASPVSTINQIVVSEKPYPTAQKMQQALSPLGFYGGRSAVNYTQTGSFIQYLLGHYPVDIFKKAYKTGRISQAYGVPFDGLVKQWQSALDTVRIDSTDRKTAARLYNIPSLFQQPCPHVQSTFARHWDRYNYFMAEKDTVRALYFLDKARQDAPASSAVKDQWAFLNLKTGQFKKVERQASLADSTTDGVLLDADALASAGKYKEAKNYLNKAAFILKQKPDPSLALALHLRQDSLQWRYYRRLIYEGEAVSDSVFKKLYLRTQMRAIRQALNHKKWKQVKRYARIAIKNRQDEIYFESYIRLIQWLAFKGELAQAQQWIAKIKALPLRPRYRERLQETQKWGAFVER